jgi:hypothetical protein
MVEDRARGVKENEESVQTILSVRPIGENLFGQLELGFGGHRRKPDIEAKSGNSPRIFSVAKVSRIVSKVRGLSRYGSLD